MIIVITAFSIWFIMRKGKFVLSPTIINKRWLVVSVITLIAILGFWFWWNEFEVWFANWLANSRLGLELGLSKEAVVNHLWWVALLIATLVLVWNILKSKTGVSAEKQRNLLFTFIIFPVIVGVVIFQSLNEKAKAFNTSSCTTQAEINSWGEIQWAHKIVICPDSGQLYVKSGKGKYLSFYPSPRSPAINGHQMTEKEMLQFVYIRMIGSYQDKLAEDHYRLVIPTGEKKSGYTTAFVRYDVPAIIITVKPSNVF